MAAVADSLAGTGPEHGRHQHLLPGRIFPSCPSVGGQQPWGTTQSLSCLPSPRGGGMAALGQPLREEPQEGAEEREAEGCEGIMNRVFASGGGTENHQILCSIVCEPSCLPTCTGLPVPTRGALQGRGGAGRAAHPAPHSPSWAGTQQGRAHSPAQTVSPVPTGPVARLGRSRWLNRT